MTTLDFSPLKNAPRLLMQAELKPLQGDRFQPTGFADLGAARYTLADGTEMLLVESAQSVANRLEAAVWDDAKADLIDALHGLPYVRITVNTKNGSLGVTTTLHEPHRLNSGYLWTAQEDVDGSLASFKQKLIGALGVKVRKSKKGKDKKGDGEDNSQLADILNMSQIARALFQFDPSALLHGVFLEKIDSRLRLSRALSGFIEARNVRVAESGGVKTDRIDPTGDPKPDFGMVPFHRTEFVAEAITAYFNLDLALLRGYGLPDEAIDLLIALALFKVQRFLAHGLRLRTACDLEVKGQLQVTRPSGYTLPTLADLETALPVLITACTEENPSAHPPVKALFARPPVTNVTVIYEKRSKKGKKSEEEQGEKTAQSNSTEGEDED